MTPLITTRGATSSRRESGSGPRRLSAASLIRLLLTALLLAALTIPVFAQEPGAAPPAPESALAGQPATTHHAGGEANLVLPDLDEAQFLGGIGGRKLLMFGLIVSALGLVFGFLTYTQLRNLPVHRSMREISELIYETCKTYLHHAG